MNDKDVACLLSKQEEETTIRSASAPPPPILSAEKWNIDRTVMCGSAIIAKIRHLPPFPDNKPVFFLLFTTEENSCDELEVAQFIILE